MIRDKKGQALVEFVIILPIIIMIVFCLVDFGKIYYTKSNLEGIMDKVVDMYNNGKNENEIKKYLEKNSKDVSLKISNDNNEYINIEIGKDVDIFTPGLNVILSDPYNATVKRVLPYE